MNWTVNAYREAVLRMTIRGAEGEDLEIEAVVDTGFNGALTLPESLIASLRLPFRRRGRAMLADGSECLFDVYEAVVISEGEPRRISVDGADTPPLMGMALMAGCELLIQVVDGGKVTLSPLSESERA